MNILIVDDDTVKAAAITSVIQMAIVGDDLLIQRAISLSQARRLLHEHKFDVLVLDIQLPQSDDGTARMDVGMDFIAELRRSPLFPVPPFCIVVTAYDEGMVSLDSTGMEGIYGCIRYDEQSDTWARQLGSRIAYLDGIIAPKVTGETQYDFDVGIVCALEDIELQSVLDLPWNWRKSDQQDRSDPSTYYIGTIDTTNGRTLRVVAAAAPQMGMAAMAVLCMKLIQRFRPRYVGMPGIAAGVKKEKNVNFGDVLVAELSWDYGSGKLKVDSGIPELAPDPRPIYLDPFLKGYFVEIKREEEVLALIKTASTHRKPSSPLRIHIGPLASGAAVIADESIVASILKQQRKLVGIEMEIYALYYAAVNCAVPRPKVFALKSICDYGDREKSDKYQAYAAYTSASVLQHLVCSKLPF